MGSINYRFRLTALGLTIDKAFPGTFLHPTSETVMDYYLRDVEILSQRAVHKTAKLIEKDLRSATRTWSWEVKFDIRSRISAKSISVIVSSNDPIFRFIEAGTKSRHAVMPFGYVSKTLPGWLGSRKGGGVPVFVRNSVNQPPIEARNFYKMASQKNRPLFVAQIHAVS